MNLALRLDGDSSTVCTVCIQETTVQLPTSKKLLKQGHTAWTFSSPTQGESTCPWPHFIPFIRKHRGNVYSTKQTLEQGSC